MGILNKNFIEDKDFILKRNLARIDKINRVLYSKIKNMIKTSFNLVWDNPEGLTPQEILDGFGTDAGELFIFSAQMQTLLLTVNPDYEFLTPPYNYVINPDGTVTVGEKIEEDNPSDITEELEPEIVEEDII